MTVSVHSGATQHSPTREEGAAPFFSVVIPLYNVEAYIADTLERVLRQSMGDFEVILVDDASSDGTVNIVERFVASDQRLRLIRLPQRSGGPATPRNIGIANSNGDYIALLDADDIWGPDKLLHDFEALQENPTDILYSASYYFRTTPAEPVHCIRTRPLNVTFYVKNPVSTLTLCIRRAICNGTLVFDPDPLLGIEDYNFLLKAHKEGRTITSRSHVDAYHRIDNIVSYYDPDDFGKVFRRHIYNVAKLASEWSLPSWRLILWLLATGFFHFGRHIRDQVATLMRKGEL
jgi:glycosyltransferase involved in cell wall biosynthesis